MKRTALAAFCLAACFASPAAADLLTGRVVDSLGNGVPNVNIDVEDLINGGEPGLSDDITDANGDFSTTIPSGLYRVIFLPPAPPTTTHLIMEVDNVAVSGTTGMGTVTLPRGVSLSGRVVNTGSSPIANVDLDVVDKITQSVLTLQGDFTNAFGQFSIAVPPNAIEVQFETDNVVGPLLAPRALQLSPSGNLALGDVVLQPGFLVSGTVRDPGFSPVVGADIDVEDRSNGNKLFTPGDNTDSSGFFDVVVPAGNYDIEVCPRLADMLVASLAANVTISSNTSFPPITLQNGVSLFGTVLDTSGSPVRNADVDVTPSGGGPEVVLCNDNTNASGAYTVIVPTGTFDVRFSRPNGLHFDLHTNVSITGNTLLNGVLPNCPCNLDRAAGPPLSGGSVSKSSADALQRHPHPESYGTGVAGSGGFEPRLAAAPALVSNGFLALQLRDGLGGGRSILVLGSGPASIPALDGFILVDPAAGPTFRRSIPLGGEPGEPGAGEALVHVPLDVNLVGASLFAQFAVVDPAAPRGFALSAGLEIPVGP